MKAKAMTWRGAKSVSKQRVITGSRNTAKRKREHSTGGVQKLADDRQSRELQEGWNTTAGVAQ